MVGEHWERYAVYVFTSGLISPSMASSMTVTMGVIAPVVFIVMFVVAMFRWRLLVNNLPAFVVMARLVPVIDRGRRRAIHVDRLRTTIINHALRNIATVLIADHIVYVRDIVWEVVIPQILIHNHPVAIGLKARAAIGVFRASADVNGACVFAAIIIGVSIRFAARSKESERSEKSEQPSF